MDYPFIICKIGMQSALYSTWRQSVEFRDIWRLLHIPYRLTWAVGLRCSYLRILWRESCNSWRVAGHKGFVLYEGGEILHDPRSWQLTHAAMSTYTVVHRVDKTIWRHPIHSLDHKPSYSEWHGVNVCIIYENSRGYKKTLYPLIVSNDGYMTVSTAIGIVWHYSLLSLHMRGLCLFGQSPYLFIDNWLAGWVKTLTLVSRKALVAIIRV